MASLSSLQPALALAVGVGYAANPTSRVSCLRYFRVERQAPFTSSRSFSAARRSLRYFVTRMSTPATPLFFSTTSAWQSGWLSLPFAEPLIMLSVPFNASLLVSL